MFGHLLSAIFGIITLVDWGSYNVLISRLKFFILFIIHFEYTLHNVQSQMLYSW